MLPLELDPPLDEPLPELVEPDPLPDMPELPPDMPEPLELPVPVPVLLAEPPPLAPLRGTMPGGHWLAADEEVPLEELELLLVVPELVPAGTQFCDAELLGDELLLVPLGELELPELDCASAGRAMIEARAATAMNCFMHEPLA